MISRKLIVVFFVIAILNIVPWCYAKVKMIQVIMRHSNRNPMSEEWSYLYYPKDPYKNCDWEPDGAYELTNIGKQNAYELGKFLRERYGELIGLKYKSNRVYFHATQQSRTINTAQLVAAGMFPPIDDQVWNSKLSWIPIPIHFQPMDEDILNYSMAFCENYRNDRRKSEKEVNRIFSVMGDIQNLFDFLSIHTGVNYTRALQVQALHHQLLAQTELHLKLEPWTDAVFPNGKLIALSSVEYIIQSYTPRMKRLIGGVWIEKFLKHINDFTINKNNQNRGHFYACNEIQIGGILNTLGVYKAHVPGYTSTIIFELHEIDEELFVKILYRNERNLTELTIPGCESSVCPLSLFKSVLKNVTMNNYDEDCGKRVDFSFVI
ncbi:hypothetical protein PV327_000773 [Microctonus hyperodae]|uniref:Uncharacterized protein n=1 Tax=Microctonus hyperodae TaxID=165561 RepID=A0AA39G8Q2_MICHY|nr:hypothetical protein PV327_000773 [Microctonus hyperodae]